MRMGDILKTIAVAALALSGGARAQNRWDVVPDPATLPAPDASGTVAVNGLQIYFEIHGTGGPWIIFLHGGMGSALTWGNQVPVFAAHNRVLLIESRGHGRSSWDGQPITYEKMASDVVGVMDALGIAKAPIVGWSDGGIIALILGIDHADRVERIVADGANTDPDGVDADPDDDGKGGPDDPGEDYATLSPDDRAAAFAAAIARMWRTEPNITDKLGRIDVPVMVMAGQYDLIKPEHTDMIAQSIPGATEVIVPDTAHSVAWQDPDSFNRIVKDFLGVE